MPTGIDKLFISFVLLLLFHALLLMTRDTPLGQIAGSLGLAPLVVCGLGGFATGVLGVSELSQFLQSSQNRSEKPQERTD
jgi:hypothetical protein